jgi:hypothetical protein
MANGECQLNNLDDLREYVYETLCRHESLVHGAFRMTEQILIRSGRPCGMHFSLHGPRAVLFSAIWETSTSSILFYDSTGRRFQKTQLVTAPELELAAA